MNNEDLIRRLREQAQAHGHVWVDVMRLLLEAAEALEEHHYADAEHEHLGCPMAKTGIYATVEPQRECFHCGPKEIALGRCKCQ